MDHEYLNIIKDVQWGSSSSIGDIIRDIVNKLTYQMYSVGLLNI